MRTYTEMGERFPETSAHLLAMQRMTTAQLLEDAEKEKLLALPDGLPVIDRGEYVYAGKRWHRYELR